MCVVEGDGSNEARQRVVVLAHIASSDVSVESESLRGKIFSTMGSVMHDACPLGLW